MSRYLFTSESVAQGHPDKIADQISDAILDAYLAQDSLAKVACETLVTTGLVVLAGEISSSGRINFEEVIRQTIQEIGYTDSKTGFDYRSCGILTSLHPQSPDIARGIEGHGLFKEQGAGDQGLMFGFACDDTPEYMPLPIQLSHNIVRALRSHRVENKLPYLLPDGKTQITVEYSKDHVPQRIHTVVLSTQHMEDVSQETIHKDMRNLVESVTPPGLIDGNTIFFINPTGRFVIGGPQGDTGLTGRKNIVDTYGGMGHHGGGAFSGKDPTKVDRSGAYAARYVAKNIVAAGLARRCEVQISFAIGVPFPVAIKVDTFGTGTVDEESLARAIPLVFNLTPRGIIEMLDLRRPIYKATAFGGHFGRNEHDFTWERTDRIDLLKAVIHQF